MPLPVDVETVTVNIGPVIDYRGQYMKGRVHFLPPAWLLHAGTGTELLPVPQHVDLDEFGVASIVLPATDGTHINPTNFTYHVLVEYENVDREEFDVVLPRTTPVVDFETLLPVESSIGVVLTPELAAQVSYMVPRSDGGDDSVTMRAMLAAGIRHIVLKPVTGFHWLSSLGDDFADINDSVTITAYGADCLIGTADGTGVGTAGLSRTADYVNDPTVGWLFMPNTHQSAITGHEADVDVSAGTQSAGAPFGASISRLRILGGTWRGQAHNVGLAFGNHAPVLWAYGVMDQMRVGISGQGYVDGMEARRIHMRRPLTDSWIMDTTDLGDTVIIDGCKCDPGGGMWRAKQCRGGEVRAPVGGKLDFTTVDNVDISTLHTEADQLAYVETLVTIRNSGLRINGMFYTSKDAGLYPVEIIDDPSLEFGSHVSFDGMIFRHVIRPTERDTVRSPDVYITSANHDTTVDFADIRGQIVVSGVAIATSALVWVASADSGVQAAIDAAQGNLFHRDRIRYRSGAWVVERITDSPRLVRAFVTAPALSTPSADANGVLGNYTLGDRVDYITAARDELGNYGPASNVSTTNSIPITPNVAANGAVRLILTAPETATYRLWRKMGAGVGSSPTAYVDLPLVAGTNRLYDTKGGVNGKPWIIATGGIPNTVAAVNHARDRVLLPDGTSTNAELRKSTPTAYSGMNVSRDSSLSNLAGILVSGQPLLTTIWLERGEPVATLGFWAGGTALGGGTHQWAALFDIDRNLMGVTADDTVNAWAATTLKTFDLAAVQVAPRTGLYYAGLVVVATTPPTLGGISHNTSAYNNLAPIPCGRTTDTGLDVPASCPATAGALSAFAGKAAVIWK